MKNTHKSGAILRLKNKVKGTRFGEDELELLFTIIRKRSKNNGDAENRCSQIIDIALADKQINAVYDVIALIIRESKIKRQLTITRKPNP